MEGMIAGTAETSAKKVDMLREALEARMQAMESKMAERDRKVERVEHRVGEQERISAELERRLQQLESPLRREEERRAQRQTMEETVTHMISEEMRVFQRRIDELEGRLKGAEMGGHGRRGMGRERVRMEEVIDLVSDSREEEGMLTRVRGPPVIKHMKMRSGGHGGGDDGGDDYDDDDENGHEHEDGDPKGLVSSDDEGRRGGKERRSARVTKMKLGGKTRNCRRNSLQRHLTRRRCGRRICLPQIRAITSIEEGPDQSPHHTINYRRRMVRNGQETYRNSQWKTTSESGAICYGVRRCTRKQSKKDDAWTWRILQNHIEVCNGDGLKGISKSSV
jgi:hypothetical protein